MDDRSAAFVAVFQSFLEEIVDAHRRAAPAGAPGFGGITFHRRPSLTPDEIVLPAGVLERVFRHVAGVARHRERLRSAGQHLKRGMLLHGPPRTGKTHTVRFLVGSLPDLTVILLDGLSADADVAFLLTTNRASVLEPALAQRPGRVDLAVEVPLPDRAARRRLIELYARSLRFSDEALDRAAAMTEGTTASFAKELVRRSVLIAAGSDRDATDADLRQSLAEMLSESEEITRSLLGSTGTGSVGRA